MKWLIDSSVWINFLRDGEAKHAEVAAAVRNQEAYLCQPVWVELWSGMRGKREEMALTYLKDCCDWLEVDEETWGLAAKLRRAARLAGLNCPLADVLIVACAKRHGATLIYSDKHFDALLKLKGMSG